jgi:hypothetical protein
MRRSLDAAELGTPHPLWGPADGPSSMAGAFRVEDRRIFRGRLPLSQFLTNEPGDPGQGLG